MVIKDMLRCSMGNSITGFEQGLGHDPFWVLMYGQGQVEFFHDVSTWLGCGPCGLHGQCNEAVARAEETILLRAGDVAGDVGAQHACLRVHDYLSPPRLDHVCH